MSLGEKKKSKKRDENSDSRDSDTAKMSTAHAQHRRKGGGAPGEASRPGTVRVSGVCLVPDCDALQWVAAVFSPAARVTEPIASNRCPVDRLLPGRAQLCAGLHPHPHHRPGPSTNASTTAARGKKKKNFESTPCIAPLVSLRTESNWPEIRHSTLDAQTTTLERPTNNPALSTSTTSSGRGGASRSPTALRPSIFALQLRSAVRLSPTYQTGARCVRRRWLGPTFQPKKPI